MLFHAHYLARDGQVWHWEAAWNDTNSFIKRGSKKCLDHHTVSWEGLRFGETRDVSITEHSFIPPTTVQGVKSGLSLRAFAFAGSIFMGATWFQVLYKRGRDLVNPLGWRAKLFPRENHSLTL